MFFPSESEKLADMLVEEFKKNDQTNGLAMERMFRNQTKQSDKPEATDLIYLFSFFVRVPISLFFCWLIEFNSVTITSGG